MGAQMDTAGREVDDSMGHMVKKVFEHSGTEVVPGPVHAVAFPGAPATQVTERLDRYLFAVAGRRHVQVFETLAERTKLDATARTVGTRIVQSYHDPDSSEDFFACTWRVLSTKHSWVLFGGEAGVVKAIDAATGLPLERRLVGHAEGINCIQTCNADPNLVVTASKDESLRLWNMLSGALIAVMAGERGHRGQVLHADFNEAGDKVVSCGMDNSIRVWDLNDCREEIEASYLAITLGSKDGYMIPGEDSNGLLKRLWKPKFLHLPRFATRKVHSHYVDCVSFYGTVNPTSYALLTKSVDQRLVLFTTGMRGYGDVAWDPIDVVTEFSIPKSQKWFSKFALTADRQWAAVGNEEGSVFLMSFENSKVVPEESHHTVELVCGGDERGVVRQCAFSEDGTLLVAIGDTGVITQWDISSLLGAREKHLRTSYPALWSSDSDAAEN